MMIFSFAVNYSTTSQIFQIGMTNVTPHHRPRADLRLPGPPSPKGAGTGRCPAKVCSGSIESMMRRHWRPVAAAATGMTLLAGCGLTGPATTQSAELAEWFTVTSPAFRDGGEIPSRFGCPAYAG